MESNEEPQDKMSTYEKVAAVIAFIAIVAAVYVLTVGPHSPAILFKTSNSSSIVNDGP